MWLHVRNSQGTVTGAALAPGSLMVGRDAASDVFIADERASRQHSRLTTDADGTMRVEDLGSTNGTWVNGVRISGPTVVGDGDEIRVGSHQLQITAGPLGPPAATPGAAGATVVADGPADAPPVPGAWPAPAQVAAPAPAPGAWPQPAPAAPPPGQPIPDGGGRGGRGVGLLIGGAGLVAIVIAVVVVLVVTQTGGSTTLTTSQISARWGPSTLYLVASDGSGKPQDSGSAWVYDASQGLVVTNAHVVDGGTTYTVGQAGMRQKATLVGVAPCQDLAVLHIADVRGLRTFSLGSQGSTQPGDAVTALGFPEGAAETPSLTTVPGAVSVVKTHFQQQGAVDVPAYPNVVQTTAPINPGNSGGPLLNDKGQLIGVNTAGLSQGPNGEPLQNEGFAIGVDLIRQVVPGLAAGHSMGYTGMDLSFPSSSSGSGVPQGGILVTGAVPGSPAARAGFGQFGAASAIVAINGQQLDGTLVSYCKAVGQATSGQKATFSVLQSDGNQADVTVPFE